MLRMSSPTHRNRVKSFASACAMAIALAGGTLAANAGFSLAVSAQEYSEDFVALYQPVADVVNAEDGDVASIVGQIPGIVAVATTDDDKFAIGNLILSAGSKTNSIALQRQGLELQLESGKVLPENIGQFNWFVGNLSYQMEDYATARSALGIAHSNGWNDGDPVALIAETYFIEGNPAGGIAYAIRAANEGSAAGTPVNENMLLRALQAAYDNDMVNEATDISVVLIADHASPRNWINALQVVNAVNALEPQEHLDLLRLMRQTNALTMRNEFIRYIEAADPRIMSNEVDGVLAAGLAAGEFESDENYYVEVRGIVRDRMASDAADAPSLVAEARSDAAGQSALIAGDLLLSLDDFSGAEEMYAMAVAKGGVDANTALTRLGISQAHQGKNANASATFGQVTGTRAFIARLWAAYVGTQGG